MSERDPNYVPTYEEVLETIFGSAIKAAIYWTLTGEEPSGLTPREKVDDVIRMHGAELIAAKCLHAAMRCHQEIVSVETVRVEKGNEPTTH